MTYSSESRFKGVKIVGTIEQDGFEKDRIEKLVEAGMDACRIDLAYCNYDAATKIIRNVREYELSRANTKHISIILEISTTRTQVGRLIGTGPVSFQIGDTVSFKFDDKIIGDNALIGLLGCKPMIKVGKLMVELRGSIFLKVLKVEDSQFKCTVMNSGSITEKSVFVFEDGHDESCTKEAFEKSLEDLNFAISQEVEFVVIPAVPSAEYVRMVRELLEPHKIHVMSKVDDRWCLDNYAEILNYSDGIILDRTCINTKREIEVIGIARKKLIMGACARAKPILFENNLSLSTADKPLPSRIELSEIYSYIVEGVHGIILGHCDQGPYFQINAIQKVRHISNSLLETIEYRSYREEITKLMPRPVSIAESIAIAAVSSAYEVKAALILCLTTTGEVSRLVSKYRPKCPILGCTMSKRTARQVSLLFDIFVYWEPNGADSLLKSSIEFAIENKLVNRGETIVVISGIGDNFLQDHPARMLITIANNDDSVSTF